MRSVINASVFLLSFMVTGAVVWGSVYNAPPWLKWAMDLPSLLAGSF